MICWSAHCRDRAGERTAGIIPRPDEAAPFLKSLSCRRHHRVSPDVVEHRGTGKIIECPHIGEATMKIRSIAPIAALAMLVGAPAFAAAPAAGTTTTSKAPAKHMTHAKKMKVTKTTTTKAPAAK
jgi:hypothetical protein